MNANILKNYPFSLFDIDGSREIWQNIYGPYIDLIEKKLNISDQSSIRIFRNYDFAVNSALHRRIADLVILEVEEQKSNPISNKSENSLNNKRVKIEDEYSDEIKQEKNNLKITFVFTNKKKQQLGLIQMLKLSDEVKKYTQLMHKKVLKQYSMIIPQIIFVSLFGFEKTVENYLKDNLHRNLNGSMSILVVPPIHYNLWNNNFVKKSIESNNGYKKHKSGMNFEDYNNLRKNGAANQFQVKKIESYYKGLMETNNISEYNTQQLNIWGDILSINKSSTLLNFKNSKTIIKKLII
jgi:hypothetical protein